MTTSTSTTQTLFANGGEMGALMQSIDWAATPVGAVETWSQSLKTSIRIMLGSRYPMFVWWGETLINFYNDDYIPVLGKRHPHALGQPASQVWAEIWDTLGPQAEAVLREGHASWNEALLLIMERNGYTEETYFTFSYSPVPDDDGGIGGVFCACTEETHRVLSDRRLRTLRELAAQSMGVRSVEDACEVAVKTLGNNPHDIPFALLYLLDETGAKARLVGTTGLVAGTPASPIEIEIQAPTNNLEEETASQCWELSTVLATGESRMIEQVESKFGALPGGVWAESPRRATVLPLTMAGQSQPTGFLIAGISPRREFDDDYKGFFDLVSGQITTAIADARAYEEERKRAEALAEIDRAKTVFFSNVSHEFRTPLTLMLAPLEDTIANLEGEISPQDCEQLKLVQRNGTRLLKLVNTLLDFSRIEAGRVQASYEPTDLASFTTELASVFRSLIERAGMSLVVECPTLPEAVYVDREMWEKVVLNLLSNAFKFTLSGAITVRLQWLENHVEFIVADTGVGIPPEELPHLFERFHRVENSQGRSSEGSGIGLSLVQELVKLHSGKISVTSQLGQGSCFVVSLPTGTAHLPADRIGASRTLASTALGAMPYVEEAQRWLPEGDFRLPILDFRLEESVTGFALAPTDESTQSKIQNPKSKILLADDNADMRNYIHRLLSDSYQVQAVADGVAALNAIQEHPPDLVLSDVMMPAMDGFELLHSLRSNPTTQDLPVILLSAKAGEEARIEGLAAGADDYLVKPFSARELLARVESMLKLTQMRKEAQEREQALRMISESAQREAEAAYDRINQILENMTDAFIALDRDWRIIYQNAASERINGKPRSEVLGKTHWEEWAVSLGTEVERQYRRAMAEQIPVHFEHHYYSPPDHDVWLEIHAYPSPEGLGIFYCDISYRKQAESVIQTNRARLQLAQLAAKAGLWDWDIVSGEIFWSEEYYSLFGLDPSVTPTYENWLATILEDDRHQTDQAVRQAVATLSDVNLEFRAQHPTWGMRWFNSIGRTFYDANRQPIRMSGITIDITDRKQIEAERESLLAREQAIRAELERANRIKDEFLSVVSHELRTPLNPILGWSRLIQSGTLKQTQIATALETIQRNAQRQSQLIDDLLDISRILRGKLQLNREYVNLADTITAAIDTVQFAADAKHIELETVVTSKFVWGDATRLQQIVWNLLSNAVKFTPENGRVEVRLDSFGVTHGAHQIDTHARIQVTDTGKGIAAEFLPYVFERFQQEDSSTTRKFGGLGLGLAIVRQLVELHGGTVWATSPGEGQGATFTVQFPLAEMALPSAIDDSETAVVEDLAGIRVLVVDDEADSRELITFILEQAGAIVIQAASAVEALHIIAQSPPTVLISDIGMPEMDGYSLIQQLRETAHQPLPAVALTAYASESDRATAINAGFQSHLTKPIEPDTLIHAVLTLLGEKSKD